MGLFVSKQNIPVQNIQVQNLPVQNSVTILQLKALNQIVISNCSANSNKDKFNDLIGWYVFLETRAIYSNIEIYTDNNDLYKVFDRYHQARMCIKKYLEINGLNISCKIVINHEQKEIYDYFINKFISSL